MQRTNIYLEARQTEALDRLADAEGVSRAEVIRRLLDRALVGEADIADDIAVFDASFGALADLEATTRGEDARARHLDDVWNDAS